MKDLAKINLISLFILVIILVMCTFNEAVFNGVIYIIAIFVLLFLDFRLLMNYKEKSKITKDKMFNYILLACNIMSFVIIFRNFCDTRLPNINYHIYISDKDAISTLFIEYNLIFMLIMYVPLLVYNLSHSKKAVK